MPEKVRTPSGEGAAVSMRAGVMEVKGVLGVGRRIPAASGGKTTWGGLCGLMWVHYLAVWAG